MKWLLIPAIPAYIAIAGLITRLVARHMPQFDDDQLPGPEVIGAIWPITLFLVSAIYGMRAIWRLTSDNNESERR